MATTSGMATSATKEYFSLYWQQNKDKIKLQRKEYAKTDEYKKLRQEQNKRYYLKKKELKYKELTEKIPN